MLRHCRVDNSVVPSGCLRIICRRFPHPLLPVLGVVPRSESMAGGRVESLTVLGVLESRHRRSDSIPPRPLGASTSLPRFSLSYEAWPVAAPIFSIDKIWAPILQE